MHFSLLATAATTAPSPSDGPGWTDIGGFWVSVGGFALAIVLAIAGWVQAYRARGEAARAQKQADTAEAHADAAKKQASSAHDLATEAKAQTTAAERAASAAEEQVDVARAQVEEAQKQTAAALEALDHEREPRLYLRIYNRQQPSKEQFEWRIENHGRAWAHSVSALLLFDHPQPKYGSHDRLGDLGPGKYIVIEPATPFPWLIDLWGRNAQGERTRPEVRITWLVGEEQRTQVVYPEHVKETVPSDQAADYKSSGTLG